MVRPFYLPVSLLEIPVQVKCERKIYSIKSDTLQCCTLIAGLLVLLLKYMYINNSDFSPAIMCVESRPTGATGSSMP